MNLPLADRITRLHDVLVRLDRLGKRTSSFRYLGRRYGLDPDFVRGLVIHVGNIQRRRAAKGQTMEARP